MKPYKHQPRSDFGWDTVIGMVILAAMMVSGGWLLFELMVLRVK